MITILLTSYNRPRLVTRALKSLLRQTSGEWACLVLDDNSDSETLRAICQFDDPRIRVITHTTTASMRLTSTRYSCLINTILPGLKRGIVGYLTDNAEYQPELVATVTAFFNAHEEAFSGYVYHQRDVWAADGSKRLGSCGDFGHWDLLPPGKSALIGDVFGQVDHAQVFHRLPVRIRWNEDITVVKRGDADFFTRLIQAHGPIYRITDQVLTTEHLLEGRF